MMFEKEVDFGFIRGLIPLIPALLVYTIIEGFSDYPTEGWVVIGIICSLFVLLMQIAKYIIGSYLSAVLNVKGTWFNKGLLGFAVLNIIYIPILLVVRPYLAPHTPLPENSIVMLLVTLTIYFIPWEELTIIVFMTPILMWTTFTILLTLPLYIVVGAINEYIMSKITERIINKLLR